MEVKKGMILNLEMERGYGFILQEDGTQIFFHAMGVCSGNLEDLREGQNVEYKEIQYQKQEETRTKAIGVEAVL